MKSRMLMTLVILAIACHKGEKHDDHSSSTAARNSVTTETVAYRAHGNEPFWSVTINGDGMRFTSPEDSAGVAFPPVDPAASGDTLRWTSKNDKGRIIVVIWPDSCNDGMNLKTYSHASAVKLNETSYVGCAEAVTARK